MNITTLDFQVLDWIQLHLQCAFLDWLMPKITVLGNGGVIWIIIAVVLVCRRKNTMYRTHHGYRNVMWSGIGKWNIKKLGATRSLLLDTIGGAIDCNARGLLVSIRTYVIVFYCGNGAVSI